MDALTRQMLGVLDRAYDRKSWHGTNLRWSIRGLSADLAVWRPGRNRHNIQEIVVHAAYWKYAAWRRLTGEPRGSFPLKGSNWFARNKVSDSAWREDVGLLERMHRQLRGAIEELSPGQLSTGRLGGKLTTFHLVAGIAAHDLYHAGQIQLLKKLARPHRAIRKGTRRRVEPAVSSNR